MSTSTMWPAAALPLRGRRLAFSAMAVAVAASLSGCGSDEPSVAPGPAPTTIQGTVAVGAAVPGASITVRDADGATADLNATADAAGAYTIDVSSLKPPLLLTASGTLNGEPVSVAAVVPELSGNSANIANVTSLTLAVAALIAPGGDLNALASPTAIAGIDPRTVVDASTLVVNTLKSNPVFASLLGEGFDPLKTAFAADGTGIDSVLDQVQVQVGSSGVSIANLTALSEEGSAPPQPVLLTAEQVSAPTEAPALPPSEAPSNLPSSAQMLALAKKIESCLALPLAQRVTLDADKQATAVSAACSFGPASWKSDGGGWVERIGNGVLRYEANTGVKMGQPTIATVLAPPNYGGNIFQHPYCNTQTCVVMYAPSTTASGKAGGSFWMLGKINGQWDFVGNQLPYAMGVEQRLYRKLPVNTALAAASPSNYFLQARHESAIRLTFNPDGSMTDTSNVRAVVWKGPGLPVAGVVTHRSQRCGTDDRFAISNQEGLLTVNNGTALQFWTNSAAAEFIVDAARLDGSAVALPTPSGNWATNSSPVNQDIRSAAFTGTIPAWSSYTAELYYYTNTGTTPDEVIVVRTTTPFEPASAGGSKNWPTLATNFIDQYLTPGGAGAGAVNSLAQTLNWTNAADSYVNFGYLFSQNRETASNGQDLAASYWKRASLWFRINAAGDSSAPGYEWAPNLSGTSLSPYTANAGSNPNPRCGGDELLPLDADAARSSYREAGLQFRGPDRKLYQLTHFWSN